VRLKETFQFSSFFDDFFINEIDFISPSLMMNAIKLREANKYSVEREKVSALGVVFTRFLVENLKGDSKSAHDDDAGEFLADHKVFSSLFHNLRERKSF
jgi:hypothetical protein